VAKQKPRTRLIDSIKELPEDHIRTGCESWFYRMENENPDLFRELKELVLDWVSGGTSSRKFSSVTTLHKYLSGKDPARPIDEPVVRCSSQAFRRFVRELRESL